jgi:OOP family OmpA-OmpF porin
MKKIVLFLTVMTMGLPQMAAARSQDAAYDKHENFVTDRNGNCVRTKWMGSEDPCNPTPPPAPAPVAAPAPKPVVVAPPKVSLEQRTVYFDFDSAELSDAAMTKLNALAQIINQSSAIKDVHIIGFTDQFGSDDYNLTLSKQRVQAVEDYLDHRSRLDTHAADIRGLGKAPKTDCESVSGREDRIACMRKERRVEIEFKSQAPR